MPPHSDSAEVRARVGWMDDRELADYIRTLSRLDRYDWRSKARPQQVQPPDYRVLLFRAGRGGGKSRSAAEAVREWATAPSLSTDGPESHAPGPDTLLGPATHPARHIAVVAQGHREVRDLCFEHPRSGLLAVIPPEHIADYRKGLGDNRLTLTNGSTIRGFSSVEPDSIRGYAFDGLWFDEYAAWPAATAQDMYDQAWFTLRETSNPRCIVTTTPKRVKHLLTLMKQYNEQEKAALPLTAPIPPTIPIPIPTIPPTPLLDHPLLDPPLTALTVPPTAIHLRTWHTNANSANLSAEALQTLEARYGNTRLGAQELGGQMLEEVDGALWTLEEVEAASHTTAPDGTPDPIPPSILTVTAVDPSGSPGGDLTGIVTVQLDAAGVMWVVADASRGGPAQHRYEATAMQAYRHGSSVVLYESAYGGDNIALGIRNAWKYLQTDVGRIPVDHPMPRIVPSTIHGDKVTRAEPVCALFQQHAAHIQNPTVARPRIWLADPQNLTALTEEMVAWEPTTNARATALNTRHNSPNRIDALVHGCRYLMRRIAQTRGDVDVGALDTYANSGSLTSYDTSASAPAHLRYSRSSGYGPHRIDASPYLHTTD